MFYISVIIKRVRYLHDQYGVFTTTEIKRGSVITKYMYTRENIDANFKFVLHDKSIVSGKNCVAKYINHSCAPNAIVEEDATCSNGLIIRAKYTIAPGKEILYDYRGGSRMDLWFHCKCIKCRKIKITSAFDLI